MIKRLWLVLRSLTLDYRERRIVRRALARGDCSAPELPSGRYWTEVL